MPRTPDALVTPALLVWARESIGLTIDEAAQKLGIPADRLRQWEGGAERPTVRQAREAARVYKRPFAAFFLAEPPTTFRVPHDFRTVRDGEVHRLSPELFAELRRVQYQRSLALQLSEDPVPTRLPSIDVAIGTEQAAIQARQFLEVELAEQMGWAERDEAFRGWRQAFERKGILVFQIEDVEVDEVRGFSLPGDLLPVVAANAKDHQRARVFTLFHELGHLMLNVPGLCDLVELNHQQAHDARIERFCNEMAAEALLPADHLLGLMGLTRGRRRRWTDADTAALEQPAELFGVSREVVLRRLVTLDVVPFDLFLAVREQLRAEYARYLERRMQKQRDQKGRGPTPAQSAVRRTGPRFARTVLSAYDREDITTSDVSEYLGVRTKHFPKVRRLAFSTYGEGAAG